MTRSVVFDAVENLSAASKKKAGSKARKAKPRKGGPAVGRRVNVAKLKADMKAIMTERAAERRVLADRRKELNAAQKAFNAVDRRITSFTAKIEKLQARIDGANA